MINIKLHVLNKKLKLISQALILLAIVFVLYDIAVDTYYHVFLNHIIQELLIFIPLLFVLLIINKIQFSNESIIFENLKEKDFQILSLEEKNKKIASAIRQNIKSQFDVWSLTTVEAEIGYLLIKGLSIKRIAELRDTSEKTVREQSSHIYHKAKVKGRAELSAYFLEDLI